MGRRPQWSPTADLGHPRGSRIAGCPGRPGAPGSAPVGPPRRQQVEGAAGELAVVVLDVEGLRPGARVSGRRLAAPPPPPPPRAPARPAGHRDPALAPPPPPPG